MQVTDILATYTNDVIKAKLIGYLQAPTNPMPITDWHDVGFFRSLVLVYGENLLGNYLNTADPDPMRREATVRGVVPEAVPKPTSSTSAWLTLVAAQWFGITRNFDLFGNQFAGTFTIQSLTLTNTSSTAYTITAAAFAVKSAVTGNRYVATTGGTLAGSGGTLTISVKAESANDSINGLNFADGPGTLTDLSLNPLPGVTATNAGPSFSPIMTTPKPTVGVGVFTVNGTPPVNPSAYDVAIVLSGQVGTATFKYRTNGGSWSSPIVTAATYAIPSGPTLNFTNDPGGSNPSFVANDIYTFSSPGSPITQQGIDPENDVALLARCLARFPSLAAGPQVEKHQQWAFAASTSVTRVRVGANSKPGYLDVTIAGRVNPLGGAVVTAVQSYIDQHEGVTDISAVAAASVVNITAGGTVTVPAARLAAVQAAAAALWIAYVNATDIGGVVRASKLEEFLMDAGAQNASGIVVNTSNLVQLAYNQVASPVDIIAAGLTWNTF